MFCPWPFGDFRGNFAEGKRISNLSLMRRSSAFFILREKFDHE